MTIPPDTKDWTWVLREPCPECGFRSERYGGHEIGSQLRASLPLWKQALARADVAQRPRADVWSILEYGCHVRDVCRIFEQRLVLILTHHDPVFSNWDQDQAAVVDRYDQHVPKDVADQLELATVSVAAAFDAVRDGEWNQTGRRSDGSVFTAETLGKYFLHDVVHHLHDIGFETSL